MTFTLVENVRGFFVTRPPLVVFMICLASFAIALITFAYIVKVKDMPNPDITEDWNTFLEPLSELEYCVISEPGAAISNTSQEATVPEQGLKDRLKQISSQILSEGPSEEEEGGTKGGAKTSSPPVTTPQTASSTPAVINVTVLVDLELIATANLKRIAARHNFTFITATMAAHHMGLTGSRGKLEANLTVVLPPLGNQSHQCQHGQCYKVKGACVTFTAPSSFFPGTPFPDVEQHCVRGDVEVMGSGERERERENHFHLEVTPGGYIHCINASILTLQHRYDPTLTVMLTFEDRSVINLHLMHTSYFLFVMIVTLLCYALIKGRATKVKVVYTQCTTDSSNTVNHAA